MYSNLEWGVLGYQPINQYPPHKAVTSTGGGNINQAATQPQQTRYTFMNSKLRCSKEIFKKAYYL